MKYNDDDSVMSVEQWVNSVLDVVENKEILSIHANYHLLRADFGGSLDMDSFYAGWLAARGLNE